MTTRSLLLLAASMLLTSAVGCAATPAEDGEEQGETDSHLTDSPAASGSNRDAVVDQARADRLVGEESTGYLGLVTDKDVKGTKKAPSDIAARVAHINIQRRAIYTDVAVRNGTTVAEAAQSTACVLLRERITIGQVYRTEDARWLLHAAADDIEMPSFCLGYTVTVTGVEH